MTIATETNRTAELTTDGVETEFDFGMLIHADTEVQVWYAATGDDYAQLTLDTHYTVVFTEDGGTVTTIGGSSPYAAGKILIIRHLALTQQTNWLFNDNHTGPQHEDDFDRAVMRDLQIQEQLNRCVGFAITSETENVEFPEPLSDNIIGWNTAATELENKAGVTGIVLLPATDGNFIVGDGTAWIVESGATARASLGLTIGTDVQAWDAQLDDIAALAVTNGNFIVGDGTNWVAEAGNTARTSLGLGTGDSPTLTGLTLSGLTETRVLFAGASGVISDDAGLTYASGTDVLTSGTYNATDEDDVLQVDGDTILRTGTAANNNLFLGCGVFDNDDGTTNVGIGFRAGFENDTTGASGQGLNNIYIGYRSGYGFTDGVNNTGRKNVGLGADALLFNTSGFENMAIGNEALRLNTTGTTNVAIGNETLTLNQTGNNNVAIGSAALKFSIGIGENVAIGGGSLFSATSGFRNVGIGVSAGALTSTGFGVVYLGYNSGLNNTIGDYNIGIGYEALRGGAGENNDNVAVGRQAGYSITTGSDNVLLGHQAGFRQTTNSNLLIIDNQDRGSTAAELTDSLIYGVFSATPASQSLRFNVGTTTWQNATHEDTDGGRKSQFNFKGQQSGGEETTLARIEVSHDGAADDQKGKVVISTNDGDDSDTPTDHVAIDAAGNTKIGDAGTTNYLNIDSGGRLLLVGTAQTWEDIRIVPGAFQFPGVADPSLQSWQPGGAGTTYKVYKFLKNDEVHFTCQIPHNYKEGSDIKPHLHWTPCDRGNEEDGNTVGWKIDYSWANFDAAFASSATVDLSDACSGIDDQHEKTDSGTITGTNKAISGILQIRLYRSDTGADDTWVGATAALSPAILEFDLHYEIDSFGSDLELVKDAP